MKVLEAIQKSTDFLARKGVESPRLQTELLLAHALKMQRMHLYLNFERLLSDQELETFRQFTKRRGMREPLQHIIGSTSFCGYEIAVNRQVLVPRPETELLAEAGWQFLNKLANGAGASPRAIDFGTGSGCIAIALAAKCPQAQIKAIDSSETALETARANAARNGVVARIEFSHGNCLPPLPVEERVDLVISNPPYIPTAEIASLEPEVRVFDPQHALDGGADGLNFYRLLAKEAGAQLRSGGRIMMEMGDDQSTAIRALFEAEMWVVEQVLEDYNHSPRILFARWQNI